MSVKAMPGTEDQSCWIDPKGKVTFVDEFGGSHCRAAEGLGDPTGGVELERKGYLHISWSSIYTGYDERSGQYLNPTQAQLDATFDLAQAIEEYHPGSYVARRFREFIEQHQVKDPS